uniref:Putative Fe-S oxidoreductase n=1 Tax=Desulfovibrio sp. U5L TaxID=596152 RepID=I2Q7N0_9BACT
MPDALPLTERGVLWLGQTCNLRCHFCYFQNRVKDANHPDHPFMSLDKAKAICSGLRDHYGNTAVDLQGGEPTIYPAILELVAHCRAIGLVPTLITNALVLQSRERCQALLEAGLGDLLISVHGLGAVYDTAVGVPGASEKQLRAIENCRELGIPMRLNTVLAKSVLPQLADVVRLARKVGASVVNFIAFNPFEDQQTAGRRPSDVPRYAAVAGPLQAALDLCRETGIEANVRYLPFCVLPEPYREHFYNFQQLPYDEHEWDYASWSWTAQNPQRRRDGDLTPFVSLREANKKARMFREVAGYRTDPAISREDAYRHSAWIRAREHCGYRHAPACADCAVTAICDGFHGDYASLFGVAEATAVPGQAVDDPCHFIRRQGAATAGG